MTTSKLDRDDALLTKALLISQKQMIAMGMKARGVRYPEPGSNSGLYLFFTRERTGTTHQIYCTVVACAHKEDLVSIQDMSTLAKARAIALLPGLMSMVSHQVKQEENYTESIMGEIHDAAVKAQSIVDKQARGDRCAP